MFNQGLGFLKPDFLQLSAGYETVRMLSIMLLLSLISISLESPMHMKPVISKAVCDDPSHLIYPETGWCYPSNTQVYLSCSLSMKIGEHIYCLKIVFKKIFKRMRKV